ncbi:SDR family oxidoreductase [Polynucleobacter nymphae]|uniref:SDR family oxidoreductase n=1 Tax=Polynucleobacter nymphae TaxID=2081043 RepID=UPI001C0D5BF7|nr:SDR family oxidoreductase [Polynucleobacter nymphae]
MRTQQSSLKQMSSTNSSVWIVGGSSPLTQAISKELGSDHSIISFGRNSSCDRHIDLAKAEETEDVFQKCIQEFGVPKAIFFCQRFRPSVSDKDLSTSALISKAIVVEVYPLLAINNVLMSLDKQDLNVRMIAFSSTVALSGQNQSPRFYSITKSMVTSLLPVLTSEVLQLGCTWNCVLLSEFFKGDGAHTAERLKQLDSVSKKHVQGKIPTVEDIATYGRFMISNTAIYMNGESIVFDGGYIKYGQDT